MKKINVITLGCSKNTVDSEHLMARLAAAGYMVAGIKAQIYIGVVQEALDLILYRQSITSRVSHIYYRTGNDPNRGIVYVNIYLFMPCLHFDTPENADSVCRSLIE